MKTCSQCQTEKPFDQFYLSRGRPCSPCKSCAVSKATARNRDNPEAHKRAQEKHRSTADRSDERRRTIERQKAIRQAAPELVRAREREYYASRSEEIAAQKRALRAKKPEAVKAARDKYNRSELGRSLMLVRKHERRAREICATPNWSDRESVAQMFEVARVLSRSGVRFSVDHVIPLKNKKVCGLHVHDNLQVMPLLQNIRKLNRFDPEETTHG